MKLARLCVLVLTLLSCSDQNEATSAGLQGRWVGLEIKTDTLVFEGLGSDESMTLIRGTEVTNGFVLPKMGSGRYYYRVLSSNIISLRSALSSNSNFNDYYFKQTSDTLFIENFFDPKVAAQLRFKKIP